MKLRRKKECLKAKSSQRKLKSLHKSANSNISNELKKPENEICPVEVKQKINQLEHKK